MFTELKIDAFRVLTNKAITLGHRLTILAGWNATGKSTILGLLGNSSELKKEEGETYNHRQFQAEFSELFKGSKDYDPTGSCKASLSWEDGTTNETKSFRITWQGETRFRIIPQGKDEAGEATAAKFKIPVLYLGLSRLYPIGELEDKHFSSKDEILKSPEDIAWFCEKYNWVMSKQEKINNITNVDVASTKRDKLGINTDGYDWRTNSAGQDNISQILLALMSFDKLKNAQQADFKGGLLLIDELEASLHPKAQEKLFNLLNSEAHRIGIQIVFTTHSLTLIKTGCLRVKENSRRPETEHDIALYYFTFENDILSIEKNKEFDEIEQDLLLLPIDMAKPKAQKIVVYCEDDEARFFLKALLKGTKIATRLDFRKISIGCQDLINLLNVEPAFSDYLTVFDGDLTDKDLRRIKNKKCHHLLLPTNKIKRRSGAKVVFKKQSPEEVVWDFLNPNNDADIAGDSTDYYTEAKSKVPRVKKEYFREHGPNLAGVAEEEKSKRREIFKDWFGKNNQLFIKTNLIGHWKKQNQDTFENFINDFKMEFNKIAKKKNIPSI